MAEARAEGAVRPLEGQEDLLPDHRDYSTTAHRGWACIYTPLVEGVTLDEDGAGPQVTDTAPQCRDTVGCRISGDVLVGKAAPHARNPGATESRFQACDTLLDAPKGGADT